MYVCVYVCACVYICMYVCMYVCYVCMHVCMNSLMFVATSKPHTTTSEPCDMTTPTGSTHKEKLIGSIVMLCLLFIAMAACVLSCCGDVETNPGPGCEHTSLVCTHIAL